MPSSLARVAVVFSFGCLLSFAYLNHAPMVSAQGTPETAEDRVVRESTTVLRETMDTAGSRIPQAMLADAFGVAIIPNVVKGSFIVGARHGRGLVFVREPNGIWHAPVFVSLTGGNIGWQVGVQSSDIILVFKTARSIQGLLSGKLTLGADAAAAAGPVGRETGVATDGQLKAEIYTYSRSRGLFAGVSIDGSVVRVDPIANGSYYRSPAPGQPVIVPTAAGELTIAVASYAGHAEANPQPAFNPGLGEHHVSRESEVIRNQLVQLAPQLYKILDEQWANFLALPAEMFRGTDPDPASLQTIIDRFTAVQSDPQFRDLADRPEFRSVDGMLRHYQHSLAVTAGELKLPPPPSR
ncbi:hypothetical protein Poly51_13500 [Rubripirellula tenax]|uniref:Ysc84 actin-binding domain-containing protein n=1 Tax=Rubripirellula tenax TaxID=2528015 RepID=A0A5C6FG51_9BACT|nr:lipid-binding SYLF domain-containing protein [Rubripirellula tenax]TWU58571.1 hypothetical protein Poly51_13500 [Rubripirellula tenax]